MATANAINEFTGSGTTSRDAFIGDGGFGILDRDIFRLSVDAGTTLAAFATPTATNGTATLQPIEPPTLTLDLAKSAGPYTKGTQNVPLPAHQRYEGDFAG